MAIKKNGKKDQNLLHKKITKLVIIIMALGFVIGPIFALIQLFTNQ